MRPVQNMVNDPNPIHSIPPINVASYFASQAPITPM